MFCERCGGELRQDGNKLICQKCGVKYGLDYSDGYNADYSAGGEQVTPRGFSSKKIIVIIVIVAILVLGGVGAGIAVSVSNHSAQQIALSGLQLAEKYLSEQNYEQAIIAFEQILKIEPMNVDAYIGLAQAYNAMGETSKATDVLQEGYNITGDSSIKATLDRLTEPVSSVMSSSAISSSRTSSVASWSSSSVTSSIPESHEPEQNINVEPLRNYSDLNFVGDYGFTECFGTYDDPFGGKTKFYAVKKVDGGVVKLKESRYPISGSEDGYIVYYGYKNDKSQQIIVEDPNGGIVSKTVINGSTDQLYIGFGACVDRVREAFADCDFAFFEAEDATYIFGKDGSVKSTKSFGLPIVYWAPYIEGVGTLTYVRGGNYFYLPDLDKIYEDKFPSSIIQNGIEMTKLYPGNKNYGSVLIYTYLDADAEPEYGGWTHPEDTYYVIADLSTGNISKAYRSIETNDGKTFKAVDLNGATVYLDLYGNEI